MIKKNKIQTTHTMKPELKDYELLAMAILSAHKSRINPDEIGNDLFEHHTHTSNETLEDKIYIADLLMSIATNYHTQIMLEIQNMNHQIENETDFSDKDSKAKYYALRKFSKRIHRTNKNLRKANQLTYDDYSEILETHSLWHLSKPDSTTDQK